MNYLTVKLKVISGSFIAAVFIFSASETLAQQPASTPVPSQTPAASDTRAIEQMNRQRILEQRQRQEDFARLRQAADAKNINRPVFTEVRRDIQTLYRKSTKKELKILAVNPDDERKFATFLKQDKGGLVKLVENLGCSENPNVIVVTEDCLKYSMPGGGSSYSFRVKDYRIPRLADLTFADDTLQISGKLVHGILTGIGDIPLEKVTLQSITAKYVVDFQPIVDYEEALLLNRQLTAGLTKDGFIYSSGLNAVDNITYILRSIAYDGELYRAVNGITYNEFDFDKRRDITIAFRIVSREPGKSITILWKELENKDSPRMKKDPNNKNQIKEKSFVAKS